MTGLVFPWQSALVVGMGASGRAAAGLLAAVGCRVRGYDRATEVSDAPAGVELVVGQPEIPAAAFDGVDLVVLSPGLSPVSPRKLVAMHAPNAEIVGELSLGLRVLAWRGELPRLSLITGTNGKSTVTSMVGHLLQGMDEPVFVGGNLGPALCDEVRLILAGTRPLPRDLVLECSSYQLETLGTVPTAVGMVLNVTPDHLDRYPSMQAYADTKGQVFAGLDLSGLALLDAGDPWTSRLRTAVGSGQLRLVDGDEPPCFDPAGDLCVDAEHVFTRRELNLAGRHNGKNALFALTAARHLGVPWSTCCERLRSFEGLPHRMTHVATLNDVAYYDDSKATNVASVLASLDGFDRPFVLIAGGRAKGEDLSPLADLLRRSGRGLVAIGESASQFLALADGIVPVRHASDMAHAVALARELVQPGQAVVLSPACASWDMFANYGERGRVFAEAVLA